MGMYYPVYLCVLVSVGMCIPLWVYVAVPASVHSVADYSTSYYCIPSRRSTTHPFVCCRYYCVAYQMVYSIPHTLSTYGTSI